MERDRVRKNQSEACGKWRSAGKAGTWLPLCLGPLRATTPFCPTRLPSDLQEGTFLPCGFFSPILYLRISCCQIIRSSTKGLTWTSSPLPSVYKKTKAPIITETPSTAEVQNRSRETIALEAEPFFWNYMLILELAFDHGKPSPEVL